MPKQQVRDEQKELAQRIEEALSHAKATLNKSKSAVAEECGVTAQAVNNWLRRGKISKRSLILLAEATQVDFMWLYTGSEPSDNPQNKVSDQSGTYAVDKKLLSESIEKVLNRSTKEQLIEADHSLLANYITAEYFKALKDDDVISTLLELNSE
jgi:transcriptional regulator with XRE-family HTH domain